MGGLLPVAIKSKKKKEREKYTTHLIHACVYRNVFREIELASIKYNNDVDDGWCG